MPNQAPNDGYISVVANYAALPATGNVLTTYITEDTGERYAWSGTEYESLVRARQVSGATVLEAGGEILYASKGVICLITPDAFSGGTPDEVGNITIPSSTIDSAATGTPITWSAFTRNTAPDGVWSYANPERIYIPDGVSEMFISASIGFSANATGGRMLRALLNGATHYSNVLLPVAVATMFQSVPMVTGWIPVTPGNYFTLNAVQNSGVSLTTTSSNISNGGGSCFARVEFR